MAASLSLSYDDGAHASTPTAPAAPPVISFEDVARLPEPADNVAIARRIIVEGSTLRRAADGATFVLPHRILEGHRFAVAPIAKGEAVHSWGRPFGFASADIAPGAYVCNHRVLAALSKRSIDFALPAAANFSDKVEPHVVDVARFVARPQVPLAPAAEREAATFQGYVRGGGRGVGTRNFVAVIGTTSATAAFARALAKRTNKAAAALPGVDGVVPIAHTEGMCAREHCGDGDGDGEGEGEGKGGAADAAPAPAAAAAAPAAAAAETGKPNNYDLLRRVLGHFVVHCNVGAALVLDRGGGGGSTGELLTCAELRASMLAAGLGARLAATQHAFVSLTGEWEADMARCEAIVRGWLAPPPGEKEGEKKGEKKGEEGGGGGHGVAAARRTAQPLKHLRIALQCGGSDAFSGVSGNPLAGWCARQAVRHGGAAVLAETDELIGAEAYVTDGARHAGVATRFVETVERFKLWMRWHGQSAEANPSGGNNFRGIYNISLKSLGAAKKKPADVRLDDVLEYGECISARCAANAAAAERGLPAGGGAAEEEAAGMPSGFGGRGYFFMDSPGNDLESIAGQVATGCNVITFTTGNGAMTNFPFVPTLKLITTSGRYELLPGEMDFNCGRFQDGEDMDALGAELFALMVRTCSGEQPSKGERAGHSQVSIWREWTQTGFAEDGEGGGGGGGGAEAREAAAKMAAAAAGASNGVGGKGDDQTVDGDRMRAQAASLLARLHHPVVAALEKAGGAPVALHAATTAAAAAAGAGASDRAGGSHVVQALQFATGLAAGREPALDAVGLVLPTSLCSSQIAVLIAERMNAAIAAAAAAAAAAGADDGAAPFGSILRFVALPHTEGCGCGTIGEDASLYEDVLLGHLTHPSVASALLLEHGCEMKHNDLWHQQLAKAGMSAEQYGWASVQIDGGVDAAYAKAQAWFAAHPARAAPVSGGLGALRLALMAAERLPAAVGALFAAVARVVVEAGGTVVVPSNSALLRNTAFLDELLECKDVVPTLAFGGRVGSASASRREPPRPGLHVMSSTTLHWVEQLCGLGAARCNIALAYAPTPKQGHPMMPVVQVAAARPRAGGGAPAAKKLRCAANSSADVVLCDFSECCLAASVAPDPTQATVGACGWLDDTLRVLAAVGSRERVTTNANDTDFQVTRGTTGCSN